jgi:hypothetical protein
MKALGGGDAQPIRDGQGAGNMLEVIQNLPLPKAELQTKVSEGPGSPPEKLGDSSSNGHGILPMVLPRIHLRHRRVH